MSPGRTLALVLLLAVMQLPARAAERMQALGSTISMELPENFSPSTEAMGFLTQRRTAAVTLVEIPTTEAMWANLQKPGAFERSFGADPNLTLEPVEAVQLGGREFLLAEGISGSVSGTVARVWLAATGPQPGLLINFSQIQGVPPILNRERVLQALASMEVGPPLSFEERVAATGFTLVPEAPFVHNAVTMNAMITLSSKPEPVGVGEAVKIIIMLPRGTPAGVPLDVMLAGYLETSPDDLAGTDTAFAGGRGIRVQGVIDEKTGLVAYAAEVRGRMVVLIAQGPIAEFTDALVATIDEIAQSVSPTASR